MDALSPPERFFETLLKEESLVAAESMVLVLPSTHATLGLARDLSDQWIVVGSHCGFSTMGSALSGVANDVKRRHILVFTDQLVGPSDASVLALLEDMRLYISPLEFILCNKYGYRLGVWTVGGVSWLEHGADLKAVAALLVMHLRDCIGLEEDWAEHKNQAMRLQSTRERSMKRQLRFLHSSTANTYMDSPAHPVARELLTRIVALGESIGRDTTA